ncbi:MAG: putative Non-specific protein-tyrosine kinase [Acidimicrobiales bacterium]|nr:putative Non-specific protein-tyrosine kinase [Acidimicrobiales bacterium]
MTTIGMLSRRPLAGAGGSPPSAPGPGTATGAPGPDNVQHVARGGAANLFGAFVYGAANFILLIVLNRELGRAAAGIVIVAIAVFNICAKVAELGCATGFVRWMSRHRALSRESLLRATLVVGLVPVALLSGLFALGLVLLAPTLANLFADGKDVASVTSVVRAMAPFLPVTAVYNVVVQGTRGFDTMRYQLWIEKVGRALALPVLAVIGARGGMGPTGLGVVWAATNLVALVPAAVAMHRLVNRAVAAADAAHEPADAALAKAFWAFTAPRAVGQASEVVVNWLDTVLVAGLVSTTAAGVYASGTRYLLPGQFAGEALMQVSGPKVSGLLSTGERDEAGKVLRAISAWQVMLIWPLYLLVLCFAPPLLRVFGSGFSAATGALLALAVAMLVVAPFGPVPSVILMSGRSRQAMFNTIVLVAINLGGNLLLVPRYGLTAAGLVWAVTILVACALPAWQTWRSLGIVTVGRSGLLAAAVASVTVGVPAVACRLLLGPTTAALGVATTLGAAAYVIAVLALRDQLELTALLHGVLPGRFGPPDRSGPVERPAQPARTDQPHRRGRTPSPRRHAPRGGHRRPAPTRHQMNEMESGFQLRDLTGFVRRRVRLLGVTVLVGLVVAAAVVALTATTYSSTARVRIQPITSDPFAPNFRPLDAVNITTETNLAKSEKVATVVQQTLGLKASPKSLLGRLTIVNPQTSLLLDVTYKGSSAAGARAGAEAFAKAYLAQRKADAEADKARRTVQLEDQLSRGQHELSAAIQAENAVRPGSGQGPAATARRQAAQSNLGTIGAKLNEVKGIDTEPGQILVSASPPTSSVGSSTLLGAVGAAGVVGLIGLVGAWIVDRRDPEVGGPSKIARMSPSTAIRFLPTSDGKDDDPALVDAAIDRLAIDLVGAGGLDGPGPRTALLVGTEDRAPAGLGEEVAASLSFSGTPALFVVIGAGDLEVRHAIPVHSFADLAAGALHVSPLVPAGANGAAPPVTWLRPSAAAESSGLLRRSVVQGLVERARTEGFEVVVFVAPSPIRRAVSSALAQWVDRVVVVVDRPTAKGAAESTVLSLLDVDVVPSEVVWS